MGSRRAAVALLLAALLPAAAPAGEGDPGLEELHAEQARAADDLMALLYEDPGNAGTLGASTRLREQCLRSGNYRSAEYLAGQITIARPERLDDRHRYVEILVARGKTGRAMEDLRDLLRERPSDCTAYGLLADLLLDLGDAEEAMEVHAAHLREHPGEAGPLYARAAVALRVLRQTGTAREAVAAMEAAAASPAVPAGTAEWLRTNAALLAEEADLAERDREAVRSREAALDGWLAAALAAAALALAGAFRLTRPRP